MATDDLRPATAPRPGDPRSSGPRPPAGWRDIAWVALAACLIGVTGVQFVTLFLALLRLEVRLSTGGMVLGFAITVVWLLTISWFSMGAWRRSVWGCPFDHDTAAPALRRCERHGSVSPTA